jgi:hypothetical protein
VLWCCSIVTTAVQLEGLQVHRLQARCQVFICWSFKWHACMSYSWAAAVTAISISYCCFADECRCSAVVVFLHCSNEPIGAPDGTNQLRPGEMQRCGSEVQCNVKCMTRAGCYCLVHRTAVFFTAAYSCHSYVLFKLILQLQQLC